MAWNMSKPDAMAHAAGCDIPPEDAEAMWLKYVDLADAVLMGVKPDADATREFARFCSGLALKSAGLLIARATPGTRGTTTNE